MKFQDDTSNIHTYIHTYIHTSQNQYVPHFFKVGGIITIKLSCARKVPTTLGGHKDRRMEGQKAEYYVPPVRLRRPPS